MLRTLNECYTNLLVCYAHHINQRVCGAHFYDHHTVGVQRFWCAVRTTAFAVYNPNYPYMDGYAQV